ncbi:MAG: anaerobic ribonucleoside-triphosphate reductase activating protein [Eubacterium sp.]|jgi:anaerobic ribonucleoside-triphosphate reductase activating protein|nr:anaerobic ribonucleoside-triphosphate reductase activating protein [Eubacterium sp.]
MYYGALKKNDIADGPGVRVTLFVSGCTHHCEGCFQPETWNFEYGEPYTDAVTEEIIEAMRPEHIAGFTLLGGEPFEPENQRALVNVLRKIKDAYPKKNIWCYSGYLYEELSGQIKGTGRARCEATDEMLSVIDVLVDGEFELAKRNLMLKFRGSENQRLINLKKTKESGEMVLLDP